MGLGDFAKGIGDAVSSVAHLPGDVAEGIGSVVSHTGDIVKGAVKAGEFVVEHPGKTAEIAGAVGMHMLKAQLDPKQLAINAGLLALTVATAGAAAPVAGAAIAGEALEGAAIATEAVTATTEAVAATTAAAKGIQTGATVAENATTAAKVADDAAKAVKVASEVGTATKAARAGSAVTKAAEATQTAVKGAEVAGEAGEAAGAVKAGAEGAEQLTRMQRFTQDVGQTLRGVQDASGLDKANKFLDVGQEVKGAAREALGLSRYGKMAQLRAGAGEAVAGTRALATGAEEAGDAASFGERAIEMGRKIAGSKVAGEGNPLANPDLYGRLAQGMHKYNQAKHLIETPDRLEGYDKAAKFAADPEQAIQDKVVEEGDKRGVGRATGYVDHGQTSNSPYGAAPSQGLTQPQATSPGASQTSNSPYAPPQGTPAWGTSGSWSSSSGASGGWQHTGGMPPTPAGVAAAVAASGQTSNATGAQASPAMRTGSRTSNRVRPGSWAPGGPHIWQGPRSQWAGGISPGYDWRSVDPLRQISSPSIRTARRQTDYVKANSDSPWSSTSSTDDEASPELNSWGSPLAGKPLYQPPSAKSAGFAMSTGQQPGGSIYPAGDKFGVGQDTSMYSSTSNVIGGKDAFRAESPILPADAPKFGMGEDETADADTFYKAPKSMGALRQPPMYQTGSRTSNRGTATIGV